jgi:predicted transcriptional regulator
MGKTTALVQIQVQVMRETVKRMDEAARSIDQPRSAWLRMAIIEKLQRDTS